MNATNVIVVGAGLAGISCARELVRSGFSVALLDKGRGIGGRMATRRVTLDAGTISFDHGAQYLPVTDGDFAQVIRAASWQAWPSADALVGVPGMSSLPRTLAGDLDISQKVEVTGLEQDGGSWHLTGPAGEITAPRVVLAIPAPQVMRLLGDAHPLSDALSSVVMSPCLTLMAAFPAESLRPFSHRLDPAHPLVWVAQDSSKPGRSTAAVTWVAQAGPEFSAMHLEETPQAIAALMLPLLCNVIGAEADKVLHAQAHRWRYAQASQPLGRPFLRNRAGSLHVGGDWCLGSRAEHAWQSGQAIARDIIRHADVV